MSFFRSPFVEGLPDVFEEPFDKLRANGEISSRLTNHESRLTVYDSEKKAPRFLAALLIPI
jgi:hypothetical protein